MEIIDAVWAGWWLFFGPFLLGWVLRDMIGATLRKDVRRIVDKMDPTG